MKNKFWLLLAAGVVLACAGGVLVRGVGAQGDETRKLWYPGMLKKTAKVPAKRRYRIATPDRPPADLPEDAVVGVTVYRLRPPRMNEAGARLLTHNPSGSAEWMPVRVGSNTALAENSLVRLSIEAARAGYLYVIDREQYADGSLGEPVLIFPTTNIRNGNNEVKARRLVEIPDRLDAPIYFQLTRSRPQHTGELLTVLVTPQPLPELNIGPQPLTLSTELVKTWEAKWGAKQGRLELVQGEGQPWTEAEKVAGGDPQQSLAADAPAPQTLYFNAQAKAGAPTLVNVRLRLQSR